LHREDIGKFESSARIKSTGHDIIHPQDVFVEKATGLSDHAAFIIARPKLLFDEIQIMDNVLLVDGDGVFVVVIREDVAHLAGIIAHRSGRVIFGRQEFSGPDDESFSFLVELYFG
jgi:hypothetical protein